MTRLGEGRTTGPGSCDGAGGREGPRAPGEPPRWTSAAKAGIGTALGAGSRVWFTIAEGIVTEVYYPRIDWPAIRDLQLVVVADGFFSEERSGARDASAWAQPGVPAWRVSSRCREGRYHVEKEVLAHPERDALLERVRFRPLRGTAADYRLYALLSPRLGNAGMGHTAWAGQYKGWPVLFARRGALSLALACSPPWLETSVGFVGRSDGWQELRRHGRLVERWERAEEGHVALTGRVDAGAEELTLALGFGLTPEGAAQCAVSSLLEGFDAIGARFRAGWTSWLAGLPGDAKADGEAALVDASRAVLRCCEAKEFTGSGVASLAIPWGFDRGDEERNGTTSPGSATWSRWPGGCSPAGSASGGAGRWSTCARPRRRTATGRRTCRPTAARGGPASSSTRPRCPSCTPTSWSARACWAGTIAPGCGP